MSKTKNTWQVIVYYLELESGWDDPSVDVVQDVLEDDGVHVVEGDTALLRLPHPGLEEVEKVFAMAGQDHSGIHDRFKLFKLWYNYRIINFAIDFTTI